MKKLKLLMALTFAGLMSFSSFGFASTILPSSTVNSLGQTSSGYINLIFGDAPFNIGGHFGAENNGDVFYDVELDYGSLFSIGDTHKEDVEYPILYSLYSSPNFALMPLASNTGSLYYDMMTGGVPYFLRLQTWTLDSS